MDYSLCVITPTMGRPTLERALTSARPDEWLVVGDGPHPEAEQTVRRLGRKEVRYIEGPHTGIYGNYQRDLAMVYAGANYLAFLDDDDIFTPWAVEAVKGNVDGGPFLFRMLHPDGDIYWKQHGSLSVGNVGGSMFVVPNNKEKLGRWSACRHYDSDFQFIKTTVDNFGGVKWAGEIIVECQPK